MTTKRNTFLSTGLALGTALLSVLLVTSIVLAAISTSFESGEPTGWTNNGAYYNTGNAHTGTGKAGMNDTNDWIRTTQETNPAVLTFWARTSGATSNWTVEVQTSPDATTWTTQASYNADGNDTGDITLTYSQQTVNLNLTGDYYIRWEMTSRSGGSFYLDDVTLTNATTPSYSISKSAAGQVAPGEVFTYTLTVENGTGITPTTTTITDVLPTGVDFVSASDGGTETGGTVTWAVSNLADGATISRTFVVTATGSHGDAIKNANYYVNGGAEWITPTTGVTVTTVVVDACDSIYHIQYPGGDSLCTGETVVVTGTVYAVYGSDFALADAAGAWHGIYVDNSSDTPSVGDQIQVQGTVEESFGLTQIAWITHTVSVTGTTPYAASVANSGDLAISSSAAESYEGTLVEVHDTTVTDDDLGNGEWSVDDGSGDVRVDDLGYAHSPTNGDALAVVRGMLYYSYSNYKIEPRDADDIVPTTGSGLLISKDAPALVAPGALFTYTLTVENQTGQLLSPPTVSDTLPLSATYASSNPAGDWNAASHTITWTAVTSLSHGSTLSYTIIVTAPTAMTTLVNDDYTAQASNWLTTATGSAVETLVRDCNTIYGIQYVDNPGSDDASPCAGETVTVQGIVYATYGSNKYFIADAAGPWHGLYVYGSVPAVGDEVEVTGEMIEYYGVTELYQPSLTVLSSGNTPYAPSVVTAAEIPYGVITTSEQYEGVFVETHDITVTAAIDTHGIWDFTDVGGGTAKADDWGYHAEPSVNDTYAILRGALAYDYSAYKVLPRDVNDLVPYNLNLSKTAPANVAGGALFTYTLTVGNYTGDTLNNIVITDTVPTSTTFAYALDSGVENGGVVSWTIAALPHTQSLTVQFAVTATTEEVVIYNDDYVASATGIITPTRGATVMTAVGDVSIHHIQGSGAASPLDGQIVENIEGIVTAVHAKGFYMQEPDADSNPQTSEGIYVYTNVTPTVTVGDLAEVDGEVDEYYEMTQLKNVTVITLSSGHTITATAVTLPLVQADDYEAYEGMLVTFPQELTVNDVYDLGKYGSATLAQGGRLFNPTNVITPGTDANNLQAANDLRKLVLDDSSSDQNPDPIPYPSPELSATNTLRSGDAVTAVTGVLSYQYGEYKLHPTIIPNFVHENVRPTAPATVGGTLKVASFNVLNYFDTFAGCTGGVGGASMNCRGADNTEEFDRQRAKIIDAILDINADIVGLMEIENDGYGDESSAIDDLVDGLNAIAGAGTYAYIDADTGTGVTNTLGTDAIKVGLLYKPGAVTPTGDTAALNDSTAISGTNFYDMKNRPVLAQSFQEQASGEIVTILVNHLKSKGSDCDDAPYNDPDMDDGQGNCNLTRQAATEAMLAWLATDPTGIADADYLIIGDLNAYAMEDPIMTLQDGGFTNLLASYAGAAAYSYVYYGQAGYLDHALASPTLLSQIADATIWHINADEPKVLDYNTENKSAGQLISLYNVDPYRASDHDPVVVGLELGAPDHKLYLPLVFRNHSS